MNIAIIGLWHLGCVYAAGSAAVGHIVHAWDPDKKTLEQLSQGIPPILEEGLQKQIQQGIASGNLCFKQTYTEAVQQADVVWITFDTPIDTNDNADCAFVTEHIKTLLPACKQNAVILVSSQLPVGSIKQLEQIAIDFQRQDLHFACSPENLRLGQAIKLFAHPDRVICGVRSPKVQTILSALWKPITSRIEWMGVESAEMTKHAINTFLATSIAFTNEIAVLCEHTGADAKEVERGLKTDIRIGEKAYVSPGMAFSGGTLARDLQFLSSIHRTKYKNNGKNGENHTSLLMGVQESNKHHKLWVIHKLYELLGDIADKHIALWGLTYKPGTDTLRQSIALEYATHLIQEGSQISAYDPTVTVLPIYLCNLPISIKDSPQAAIENADALVVCTCWDLYKEQVSPGFFSSMRKPFIIDPTRFLHPILKKDTSIHYVAIGFSS